MKCIDGNKETIIEITKHDVRAVKQLRRHAVRSMKTRLTGGKDIKIWDKGIVRSKYIQAVLRKEEAR